MKHNIKEVEIHKCFGCAVCAKACPCDIISTKIDEDGFFQPYITQNEKCIHCGLCVDVCAFHNEGLSQKTDIIGSYASWSRNSDIRKKCSSGGVGYELAITAIDEGYKVCAVRYNSDKGLAEHYIASTIPELAASTGSKYIQSDTIKAMSQINLGEKYIVFGTPCHIDSLRRYLRRINREDNFILIDFFCHGVPSYLLWWKYLESEKGTTGKVESVSWRDKRDGWHDSWAIKISGKAGAIFSKLSDRNLFLRAFLSDSCLGKACYDNCKYKYTNSSADIRIGDAWGRLYQNNSEGVSAVATYTQRGKILLGKSNVHRNKHSFDDIAEYQMRQNAKRPFIYNAVWKILRVSDDLEKSRLPRILTVYEMSLIPHKIIRKIKKILK